MSSFLISGGAGFIGGSVALELAKRKNKVIIIDNLSNSNYSTIKNIKNNFKNIIFYKADISDKNILEKIFENHDVKNIYHFAGLKSVNNSILKPNLYLNNNVYKSKTFISFCLKKKISNFIFSSSATVYGEPKYLPIDEAHPINPTNPYGISKLLVEQYIKNISTEYNDTRFTILRYFNPIGSIPEFSHGEVICNTAENLLPNIILSIKNNVPLKIYGNNYDTEDGTAVRDFIHISDLVNGHISCLEYSPNTNFNIFNLGTGFGVTVLKLLNTFIETSNANIAFRYEPNRSGDISISYACAKKANEILKWKANKTLKDMCIDAWNFYK